MRVFLLIHGLFLFTKDPFTWNWLNYIPNIRSTFNGVDPCLFSSFKEKVNIKINLATPSFKDGGAFSPLSSEPFQLRSSTVTMTSVSSSDSRKRQRALDSRGLFGGQMGGTLSIPSDSPKDIPDQNPDDFDDGDDGDSVASHHKKRPRSRSKSNSPHRKRATPGVPDGPSANVCMVKKSGVGTIRGWMKHGIESKQEVVTLRSSYKPSFEGSFELMAPELDPSMVRKWLRNIGDTSEKPKLKDFWEKNLLTLQREIKDVFEPLIFLLNSVTESNEAHLPAQTATRLLGHVFAHMTQMRRFNAMRHVAPKFSSMVMDPLLFSSREHRYLFGEKFITALDKEAELDSKMDKIGRYGGHSSSRKGNYSNRKGDQQSSGSRSNNYSNNYSNNNNKGGANWNWGKQQPQQPKVKQQHGSYQNGERGEWEGGGRTKKKGTHVSSSPPFVPFSLFSPFFPQKNKNKVLHLNF
jgi:hypothetical protein